MRWIRATGVELTWLRKKHKTGPDKKKWHQLHVTAFWQDGIQETNYLCTRPTQNWGEVARENESFSPSIFESVRRDVVRMPPSCAKTTKSTMIYKKVDKKFTSIPLLLTIFATTKIGLLFRLFESGEILQPVYFSIKTWGGKFVNENKICNMPKDCFLNNCYVWVLRCSRSHKEIRAIRQKSP